MASVKFEEQIGGAIIRLKGQFVGGKETDELKAAFNKAIEKEKTRLIVDMEKASYLNSTALGILISAHANFSKRGGKIILCSLNKSIENIFVITKLSLIFPIAENLEEAIKMMSEQ